MVSVSQVVPPCKARLNQDSNKFCVQEGGILHHVTRSSPYLGIYKLWPPVQHWAAAVVAPYPSRRKQGVRILDRAEHSESVHSTGKRRKHYFVHHIRYSLHVAAEQLMNRRELEEALQEFSREVHELERLSAIPVLHVIPSACDFEARYVARNTPCVFKGAAEEWPARRKWSLHHIAAVLGEKRVTCTFTPDGRADSVKDTTDPNGNSIKAFVLPHSEQMTMKAFAHIFRASRKQPGCFVPSVQFQNGNMAEFEELECDLKLDAAWAADAFGSGPPDAINIWLGDSRSVTSFHKVCEQDPSHSNPLLHCRPMPLHPLHHILPQEYL